MNRPTNKPLQLRSHQEQRRNDNVQTTANTRNKVVTPFFLFLIVKIFSEDKDINLKEGVAINGAIRNK